MKKLLLLMVYSIWCIISYSQIKQEEWENMIKTARSEINNVFIKECPNDMSIDNFINGVKENRYQLSPNGGTQIIKALYPIRVYGESMAIRYKLEIDEDDRDLDLIFYGSAPPRFYTETLNERALPDWDDVLHCAGQALGLDAIAMLSQSTASAWSWGIIKSVFKKVAKKMLGPIGVMIATIDFVICLAD